ncbi:hypothetical protein PAESOLCIP111_06390 [Paenibacillus solanacearum]|uniref:Uncharacterized protein n=1 Tax=Paenibacillus solanacearum TaxID=2048548 RepID=A0A916KAT9_9BACL|nr:hypothetical protein PAESOLCIP111_06390 [Paenibacillus solanacearum]
MKEEIGLDITIKKLLWVEEGRNDKDEIGYIYYFLEEKVNGEPTIGYEPELPRNEQKIMDVVYKGREEIMELEKVYPEVMKHDYFWKVMKEESHNPYVNRPSKGFGKE